ncbi:MAG TPA: hypothetical protein VIV11_28115 [Kofleriaceae bacterium]
MRIAPLALLLGCTVGNGSISPPREPEWPTLQPAGASFNTHVVALRTTLGRAAIRLEMRGRNEVIRTSTCSDPEARQHQVGCVRCELAGPEEQLDDTTLDAITRAFDRYPASFLVASHIESVALCKSIVYEDIVREHGTAGTVDYMQRRLFVSVESFLGRAHDDTRAVTAEDIVHHELFHLIEFEHMRRDMSDPEWRLHNPIGFEYRDATLTDERPASFVNAYATTNEIEDRASTFQYLMSRPAELCEITRSDADVRAKVKLIWTRVGNIDGTDFLRKRALCAE